MSQITVAEKNKYSGLGAGVGHGPGAGKSIVELIIELQEAHNAVISGQATVANGATTVTVAVGAAYDGANAVVGFGETPTVAATVSSAVVAGGDLVITTNADNTADLLVNWFIDAR